jgi:PAS domain S-box-containing protein
VTPLYRYLGAMDEAVLWLGVCFIVSGALGYLTVKNPLGVVFSATSFFISTLAIFLLLDLFPALVKPLHFDMIPYFNYRLTYVPDPVLGFRERPYHRAQIATFRGYAYSPLYGIDVPAQKLVWQTDGEGFRNQSDSSSADIAVIGSSFPEYGTDFENTYPRQLENKLGGQRVVNFAKAGYGPFQYLEVLKRYVVKKKPQYVLFAFYPPGDVDGYMADWVTGRKHGGQAKRNIAFGGFFPRYRIALQQSWQMLTSGCWTALQLAFQKLVGSDVIHPDVAVLRLPNNVTEKLLLVDRHSARSTDDLLSSPEWHEMEKVLADFKHVTEQNQIVPLIVYIPALTEIYAEYSTLQSGTNWLAVRESQIATSNNNEEASRRLAAKLGIELISLRPSFKQAARQGKLLYYRLDSHWNEEGRAIAAKATAEAIKVLQSKSPNPKSPNKSDKVKPTPTDKAKQVPSGTQQVRVDGRNSIITRTIDGKISFWNSQAEELYGWTKDEAKGKVSHSLLKTQFPQPLEQIDAELMQKGRWEGKLVHATKDGRRVVVESRWLLDPKGRAGAVVEINTQSADS